MKSFFNHLMLLNQFLIHLLQAISILLVTIVFPVGVRYVGRY